MQPLFSVAVAAVCCLLLASNGQSARHSRSTASNDIKNKTPNQHYTTIETMSVYGEHMSIIEYLEILINHVEHLNFDDRLPSLYMYLGVAYHDASRSEDAVEAFKNCSRYHMRNPDPRCLMNEAEASTHIFQLTEAVKALEKAVSMGFKPAYGKLLRVKGWTNDWKDLERISHDITAIIHGCISASTDGCAIESGPFIDYVDPSHQMLRFNAMLGSYIQPRDNISTSIRAQLWTTPYTRNVETRRRLKVGLLSSDFGVHPVATLIRGFVQFVDTSKVELFCFALTEKRSWWGINISKTVEHFINLASTNTVDAAMEIALEKIDILIDLNGVTIHSGLGLMGHRPAPVQISYLGLPSSTGAPYIDYYLADHVAVPAEDRTQFVEKLALIPTSSIVNDYAQIRGGLLDYNYDHRMPRDDLKTDVPLNDATFLFATLSNSQKVCPSIFHTWMNILNRMPGSKMVVIAYSGSTKAIQNLRSFSPLFGNRADSLAYGDKIPWAFHLQTKTALDMILDTRLKNGHTTGLDGLWAGVPTVTLGGMSSMGQRCGESFAAGLDLFTGLAFSLKEYEDIAIEYARNPGKLKIWRNTLGRKRVTEPLFDVKHQTRNMERVLESIWEVKHISEQNGKTYNVVNLPAARGPPRIIDTHQVDADNADISIHRPRVVPRTHPHSQTGSRSASKQARGHAGSSSSSRRSSQDQSVPYAPLPQGLLDSQPLLLDLGGLQQLEGGWIAVNNNNNNHNNRNVQISSRREGHGHTHGDRNGDGHVAEVVLRDIGDLHGIPDGAVDALHCGHNALQHLKIAQLSGTLEEWSRVLRPGGVLLLGVADLKIIARLLLDDSLDAEDRFSLMTMIYGAQADEFDFHHMGFDDITLPALLAARGFCSMRRVEDFTSVSIGSVGVGGADINININSNSNINSDNNNEAPQDLSTTMKFLGRDVSMNIVARKCGQEV